MHLSAGEHTAKPGACRSRTHTHAGHARVRARITRTGPVARVRSQSAFERDVSVRGCTMQLRARVRACASLCMCTGVSAPAQRGDRRPGPTRERSTLTSPNDRRRCTPSFPLIPPHRLPPRTPFLSPYTACQKSRKNSPCLQSARVGFENAGAGLVGRNLCHFVDVGQQRTASEERKAFRISLYLYYRYV